MMKITDLKVNHIKNPVGYDFDRLRFQWKFEDAQGERITSVRVCVWEKGCRDAGAQGAGLRDAGTQDAGTQPAQAQGAGTRDGGTQVYDSGFVPVGAFDGMEIHMELTPKTAYDWNVTALTDEGGQCESEYAVFETGRMDIPWTAGWLMLPESEHSAVVSRRIRILAPVRNARIYICAFGLYEVYVDDQKVGDEYLLPGYYSYDLRQEYQTLDLTKYLSEGEHTLSILLGDGWYRGRFVFEGGYENLYGNCLTASAEIDICCEDGTEETYVTDDKWQAQTSCIGQNNIYDGEQQDYHLAGQPLTLTVSHGGETLQARTGMPLKVTETYHPAVILHTPKGETVLDFGEMVTGWVQFYCREEKDAQIRLQYGELLQDDCFYRDNLRTAKAQFTHISEGKEQWIRPHFTYYGFRYVKIEGIREPRAQDFTAVRLMSECEQTGWLETGNEKVNRLIANQNASQKCNFLDIPTDCPQRDERMGWTCDIAVFSDTACFNRDCSGFLDHYMTMMRLEQKVLNGVVPVFVPRPKLSGEQAAADIMLQMCAWGVCAWGDAAAVIPWTLYEHYRDTAMLKKQYPVMKDWVKYVSGRTMANPIPHLWQNDIQLGDWLALDNDEDPASPFGKTDPGFIATACYYHSLELTDNAARVLCADMSQGSSKPEELAMDIAWYEQEMQDVRAAFTKNFLNPDGTVKITETQTAYAAMLAWGLTPDGGEDTAVSRLKALVRERDDHLSTGFIGTPLLCQALSSHGAHDTACRIFLQETYPGWLHEVNLGAVTMWERWNSLGADGKVSSTGMNSMNHYAYGSIAAWMYRYLCGFEPCTSSVRTMRVNPMPCKELGWMQGAYETPWGRYELRWEVLSENEIRYTLAVPAGSFAVFRADGIAEKTLGAGKYTFIGIA